jgi:hypothetical protein
MTTRKKRYDSIGQLIGWDKPTKRKKSKKVKLKPCMFCTEREYLAPTKQSYRYYVLCLRCGARGPECENYDLAKRHWNRRGK